MPEVPYLVSLAEDARRRDGWSRLDAIAESIRTAGYWEETVEWRISTVTTMRIDIETHRDRPWYGVSVKCETDLTCHAPTLERAVEYLGVFERLTMDLFWSLGWASWAAKGRLEPLPTETTP
jgi:hypothetical protein